LSNLGFLEAKFDTPIASSDDDRFSLSLIPYEETTTYKKGTRNGPEAIVDASGHIELFDEKLHIDASKWSIRTLRPAITDLDSIVAHAAGLTIPDGGLAGFIGGEHSVTPAIIEGLGLSEIGIVWVDAHSDLRKNYCGSDVNHACAGYNSLPFGRIVQIGIRSLAEEEVELIERNERVRIFPEWGDEARAALAELPDTVYFSFDLDGFSPELMRAVGTPEPGGVSWQNAMEILDFVYANKSVRAFDVVELCPNDEAVASSFPAARLVYKMLQYHAHYNLRESGGSS